MATKDIKNIQNDQDETTRLFYNQETQADSKNPLRKLNKKQVAMGAVGGIVAGATVAGSVAFGQDEPTVEVESVGMTDSMETTDMEDTVASTASDIVGSNTQDVVAEEVEVSANMYDAMTFDEAFAAARAEMGAGATFEWHGKLYGTYYAGEKNDAEERAELVEALEGESDAILVDVDNDTINEEVAANIPQEGEFVSDSMSDVTVSEDFDAISSDMDGLDNVTL